MTPDTVPALVTLALWAVALWGCAGATRAHAVVRAREARRGMGRRLA